MSASQRSGRDRLSAKEGKWAKEREPQDPSRLICLAIQFGRIALPVIASFNACARATAAPTQF